MNRPSSAPNAQSMTRSLAERCRREHGSPVPASILGMQVHATTYAESTEVVCDWAERGEARHVCVANVHMVMEAWDDPGFRAIVNAADLVTPDGMPLVWVLRRKGFALKDRVYGPTLTRRVVAEAARRGIPVGLLGGAPEVLGGIGPKPARRLSGIVGGVSAQPAVPPAERGRGSCAGRGFDQRLGCADPVRRARMPEAGALDGGARGGVRSIRCRR
jgi:hypothetical protein